MTTLGLYEKAIADYFDFETKVKLAKAAGFHFLELSVDESELRLERLNWDEATWKKHQAILKQYNFACKSLCLSAHRKFPLGSHDPKIREKALIIFDQALQICKWMQIPLIQLAGYDVYYEESDAQTQEHFLKNLKIIAQKAQAAKVMVGIETMDTPFLGTASRVRKFVDKVNNSHLQIYPDLGNLFQWSNDPQKDLVNNSNFFVQVHLKQTRPNVFRDLEWHQGNVPLTQLLKVLKKAKYNKFFVAEMWSDKTQHYNYNQQLAILQDAYDYIKVQMIQAGYKLC